MDNKRKEAGAPKVPDHADRKIGNVFDAGILELNSRLATHKIIASEKALDEILVFSRIMIEEITDAANSWKKEKNNFTTRHAAMKECDESLDAEFDKLSERLTDDPINICSTTKWAVNHFESTVRRGIRRMIRGWTYD